MKLHLTCSVCDKKINHYPILYSEYDMKNKKAINKQFCSKKCRDIFYIKTRSKDDFSAKQKIKWFIENKMYLNKDLTLSKISTYIGMNPVYVNDLLKEMYGKSYITLINDLRLEAIIDSVLYNEDILKKYTISAVVKEFGFTSYNTFLYAFKRKYKTSPKKYFSRIK